jgi:uncharacterized membrane protein YccC
MISTWLPWDRAAVHRALLLALAAMLSFAIAALLHVRNAYWAAMPVWVIGQSARGLLLEKAVFRVIGTLIGAAVGFGLVHLPVSPHLQILLLALWIAVNAGTTHVLRGVHGYGALLAGMTAAVVAIPVLLSPGTLATALVVARVDCTLIGVIVASAVLAFQTPESPLAEFYAEVRAVSAEAVSYALLALRGRIPDDGREERRILGHISRLDESARLLAAGSVAGYRRLGDVDRLMLGSLSTMAAARALPGGGRIDRTILDRLEALAGHLRAAWTRPFHAPGGGIPAGADPALLRLELGISEILAADQVLGRSDSPRAYRPEPRPAGLAPHREWTLAWREGALAGGASFAALALALAVRVPSMGLLALGICIFVMVLGSMPLPQLIAPTLLCGVGSGVLAALFYRLAVQPSVGSTAGLILSILPFVLAGGFFRTHPRFGAAGIDFSMCFMLASQAGMPASHDVARILLDSGALVTAAGLMASLFILLPPRARRQASDAAALIRRDLQRILENGTADGQAPWRIRGSRQILRLALHLGRAKEVGRRKPLGLLAALNLGQAMTDLQERGMPGAVAVPLAATLDGQMHPAAAARTLLTLAGTEDPDGLGRLIQRLAEALDQAQDLLAL